MVKRAGGVTNNDKLVNDLAQEVGLLLLVVVCRARGGKRCMGSSVPRNDVKNAVKHFAPNHHVKATDEILLLDISKFTNKVL
jgi:hypothetical protein